MKLWILRYEAHWMRWESGFVVRAETEKRAREIADKACPEDGDHPWLDPDFSTCEELAVAGEEGEIMSDPGE